MQPNTVLDDLSPTISYWLKHTLHYIILQMLTLYYKCFAFSALTLLVGHQEEHTTCKKNSVMRCWRGYLSGARCKWFAYGPTNATATSLSFASLKPRLCLTFLKVAYPGRPSKGAIKRVSIYLVYAHYIKSTWLIYGCSGGCSLWLMPYTRRMQTRNDDDDAVMYYQWACNNSHTTVDLL